MRKIIFILAVLTGICVAFSDELRNKTALTVKTSEPFSNSIICGDIDSITFSNIALDGSVHDSVVIQKIYTPDSVHTYVLDSIQMISIQDISRYKDVDDLFMDLYSYLESICSESYDVNKLSSVIMSWLEQRGDVASFQLLDDGGIIFEHLNGLYPIIAIEEESVQTRKFNQIYSRNNPIENVYYHNIESKENEIILYNNNILYFQGRNLVEINLEPYVLQEVIDDSPLNMTLNKNTKYGDLNWLVSELPKADLAFISATHGIGDGGFQISDNMYRDISDDLLSPVFNIQIKNRTIVLGKDWFTRKYYAVTPRFFESYPTGNGIGILNYCWSFKLKLFLDKLQQPNKNFAGYRNSTMRLENIERSGDYLMCLLHGYTHSDAINMVNEKSYDDGNNFELYLEDVEQIPQRFLSIENLGGYSVPLRDYCSAKYKIRGWKNLKKEIDKVKIWYKGERFEHPDESCITVEYDLKEQYMYHFGLHDWLYDMGPCIVGDKLSFNSDGPDFYVNVMLNGIDADTLYYALGFEYNNGDVRNVYHSDVTAVGGIMPGVTPGQCIDMGLPSGTKWAAWNVGASKPEEYGGSYGWGEPTGTYTEQPYSTPAAGGYSNYAEVVPHYGGENPASNISGSKYDIAHAKWGNGWRLPSVEQWNELMNDEYTTWQHYTLNGVSGLRIISKINGNKLFFPVEFGNLNGGVGSSYFWTGELDADSENKYSAKIAYINRYFDAEISKDAGASTYRWSLIRVRPVK